MSDRVRLVRVFLSSPSDVADERALARQTLQDLNYDPLLRGAVTFEAVAWDSLGAPGLEADRVPQRAIEAGLPLPSQCDIFVGIFWARMGTPFEMNGQHYRSGTVYELEDARKSNRTRVLIYRRGEAVQFDPADPRFEERCAQWNQVEDLFAEFRGEGDAPIGGYNGYQTPSEFAKLLADHIKHILKQTVGPVHGSSALLPQWEGSPFPGLRAFTTADAPIFFGRGRETDELIRKVERQRVCIVMGASGSGKSSLVGAGLLPRLSAGAIDGSTGWLLPVFDECARVWRGLRFTPAEVGDDPFEAFASQLEMLSGISCTGLASQLAREPWSLAQALAARLPGRTTFVVFVDQFEELFTSCVDTLRVPFIRMLGSPSANVKWVLTVRSDFYHRCVDIPELSKLLETGQFPLTVPTDTLLDMIARPAQRALLDFDEGLTWRILEDTGHEPGSLALMAYALDELYELASRRHDRRMSLADYEALGGVQGAIGKRAESTYLALPGTPAEREECLWRVFRELVEVDERGTATRRRAPMASIAANAQGKLLIEAFTSARLLTSGTGDKGAIVEVAHEALMRSWGRLAQWLESVQADLRLLRQLKVAAAEWLDSSRSPDYLWRGDRAAALQTMIRRLGPDLSADELEFARPETEHLLGELELAATTHIRREMIGQRLLVLGDPRPGWSTENDVPAVRWCAVKGTDGETDFVDDKGVKYASLVLTDFYITAFPITVAQLGAFIDARGMASGEWWKDLENPVRERPSSSQSGGNYPVDSITWHMAMAFSRWLDFQARSATRSLVPGGDTRTWRIRLPHECEWQWASGGHQQHPSFPWGEGDDTRCNLKEAGIGRTVAVGMYPLGAAHCGALDMIGNVREWCLNAYKDVSDVGPGGNHPRAMRGGSVYQDARRSQSAYRASNGPGNVSREAGFRVVFAPDTNLPR